MYGNNQADARAAREIGPPLENCGRNLVFWQVALTGRYAAAGAAAVFLLLWLGSVVAVPPRVAQIIRAPSEDDTPHLHPHACSRCASCFPEILGKPVMTSTGGAVVGCLQCAATLVVARRLQVLIGEIECRAAGIRRAGRHTQTASGSRERARGRAAPRRFDVTSIMPTCTLQQTPCYAPGERGITARFEARPISVHAEGSTLRRSAMVRTPAAIARSAHRRAALWNATRWRGQQYACLEPPRRAWNRRPHQRQVVRVTATRNPVAGRARAPASR